MPRSRLCRACKNFHDVEAPWPVECVSHFGVRADQTGPSIISDNIDAFRSMADGKFYDSKSQYRQTLKDRGLIEVGNEKVERRPTPMPRVRDTLRRTYQQLGG
jgi:hypothetical protein